MSLARQNYPEECEEAVNRQINIQFYASYAYLSMAFHFDRDDVALPGFHQFFINLSDTERERAEKLMKYQNTRGGRVRFQDIMKPESKDWGNALDALTKAVQLQKNLNNNLIRLHAVAENSNDVQFVAFIQSEFLAHQVDAIKNMTDIFSQLHCVGNGLGEYLYDKETLKELA